MTWLSGVLRVLAAAARFPWRNTARTLRERFREDRLGLSASSLTFTTTIALVPFMTVALAVFSAFPMFAKMQDVLQKWLVDSLVPETISRQVLGYLTQFSRKASRLGLVGAAVLLFTALSLVFTIDRTLNSIWRVQRLRPWAQRVLVYWAVLTLGPLVLAASLSLTTYVVAASGAALGNGVSPVLRFLLDLLEFGLLASGLMALYYYVPYTRVERVHAWIGGLVATLLIEGGKKLLAVYIAAVPTYSAVYGAFATVPILLLWIYVAWLLVLVGAVVTAYLPTLLAGTPRLGGGVGWPFQLALEMLTQLRDARGSLARGMSLADLAQTLRVDTLQLAPVADVLLKLDWVGQLQPVQDDEAPRLILLADPAQTPLQPLLDQLLLQPAGSTGFLRQNAGWSRLSLSDALSP